MVPRAVWVTKSTFLPWISGYFLRSLAWLRSISFVSFFHFFTVMRVVGIPPSNRVLRLFPFLVTVFLAFRSGPFGVRVWPRREPLMNVYLFLAQEPHSRFLTF